VWFWGGDVAEEILAGGRQGTDMTLAELAIVLEIAMAPEGVVVVPPAAAKGLSKTGGSANSPSLTRRIISTSCLRFRSYGPSAVGGYGDGLPYDRGIEYEEKGGA
jgi:hypothetical protein